MGNHDYRWIHDNTLVNRYTYYHGCYHDRTSVFITNLSIWMIFDDEYDSLVYGNMHQLPYLPQMGLAPISPLTGALPWATTAKGEGGAVVGAVIVCAVVVAVAAAIGTATVVPVICVAAFIAAPNDIIYNIGCMIHTMQYLCIIYIVMMVNMAVDDGSGLILDIVVWCWMVGYMVNMVG